jgi:MFS family permease
LVPSANEVERRRWTILALVSLSHIVGAAGQYSINTLAPFYQTDLQLTRTQVGLFFTAFYLGMACLSFPAGWLTDRLGVGRTTLGGHLFLGCFTLAAACAPSFGWTFASFLFAGLGYSFLNPASTKGVMAWFRSEERATAMGIKQTGVPAGGVVTAVLAPSMVLLIGWRGALAVLGTLNLLFGLVFWIMWREPPEENRRIEAVKGAATETETSRLSLIRLSSVSFGTAALLTAQMSLITYVPLYLKEVLGLSSYWASQALALAQIGGMTGRIGWGVISDRLFGGRRKEVLLLVGIVSITLTWLLSIASAHSSLMFVLPVIFLAGVSMIGYQGVSYALVGELAGTARTGATLGIVISVNSLGAIFGTPLFGYVVDKTGSYPLAWNLLGATVLVGVLALKFFFDEPPRDQRTA